MDDVTSDATADWERRVADLWASLDDLDEQEFVARVATLVGELPAGSAVGLFERACSLDSTGHSDQAVPLYQEALRVGLSGQRRRRAVIQLASSLRSVGRSAQSVEMLRAEREVTHDELDDAIAAVLALALTDIGCEREAVSIAVTALSRHLVRYQRSMVNYARQIMESDAVR